MGSVTSDKSKLLNGIKYDWVETFFLECYFEPRLKSTAQKKMEKYCHRISEVLLEMVFKCLERKVDEPIPPQNLLLSVTSCSSQEVTLTDTPFSELSYLGPLGTCKSLFAYVV